MGCDIHMMVPDSVRVRDFVDVFAILLGAEAEMVQKDGYEVCRVTHRLRLMHSGTTETMLIIEGEANGQQVWATWHWEYRHGYRMCSLGRTQDSRKALCVKMADFLGAMLDFNDCDSIAVDVMGDITLKDYRPDSEDGEGWRAWQQAKLGLHNEVRDIGGFAPWSE